MPLLMSKHLLQKQKVLKKKNRWTDLLTRLRCYSLISAGRISFLSTAKIGIFSKSHNFSDNKFVISNKVYDVFSIITGLAALMLPAQTRPWQGFPAPAATLLRWRWTRAWHSLCARRCGNDGFPVHNIFVCCWKSIQNFAVSEIVCIFVGVKTN